MRRIKIVLAVIVFVAILIPILMSAQSKGFEVTGKIYFKKSGDIYIRLLKEKEFSNPKASPYVLMMKLRAEESLKKFVSFKFENVPSGVYAIKCFQDINGNRKLDKGLFGPKEPWGTYRKRKGSGRPKFKDLSFEINRNICDIEIRF